MINSMTAFARQEIHSDVGVVVWELRSVNHRFLEVGIRLPESLRGLESTLREKVKQTFLRGKVECMLHFHPNGEQAQPLVINEALLKQLVLALQPIHAQLPAASVNSMDILRWPEMVQATTQWSGLVTQQVTDAFSSALQEMRQTRVREGQALAQALEESMGQMQRIIGELKQHLPQLLNRERERLQHRISALQLELDPHRWEQEIALLAQKMDVSEEITRFMIHVDEVRRVLAQTGAAGRRLDFLLQEMQREANTLGAKSMDVTTSHAAVDLKVLIEQMREQVQNIE